MTPDAAAAIVEKLTYRPGWKFECYVEPLAQVFVLRLGTREIDAENPAVGYVPVVLTSTMSVLDLENADVHAFLAWVYQVAHQRVEHELREWLRFDGRPIVEPHPEKWARGMLPCA